MNHFKYSSAYYDLLYSDKDYKKEAEYIHHLIGQYSIGAKSVLNLGCGTGKHDFELINLGYDITGVDQSSAMIDLANASNNGAQKIQFLQADIRDVRLSEKFDVIVSMFNVMGYQKTNEDMIAALETVKYHLAPSGIFIFDIWHSPAVYKNRPEIRIKRLSDENYKITRLTEPVINDNDNVIDIQFEILIEETSNHSLSRIKETHSVRHFSTPEIKLFADHCGLEVIHSEEFLTSQKTNSDKWDICYILKAKNEAI